MRDIQISKRDNPDGLTQFSILNITTARGISILVEKVTKAVYSKTKTNAFFEYNGMDVYQAGAYSADPQSLAQLRIVFSLALKEVEKDIIRNTLPQAPQSEQLLRLVLVNLFFNLEKINGIMQNVLYLKLRIYPLSGSPEYVTFSIDNQAW